MLGVLLAAAAGTARPCWVAEVLPWLAKGQSCAVLLCTHCSARAQRKCHTWTELEGKVAGKAVRETSQDLCPLLFLAVLVAGTVGA